MMNRQGLNKAISNKMQSMGGMNAMKTQVAKAMPTSMFYRPAVTANKARGTMSSATYAPIPNSMSGMGQSGMAAQGSQAGMGIPQPQSGGYSGGVGPKRIA
jgi:hypothetical protein